MSLTAALASHFSSASRHRGEVYAAEGRVHVTEESSTVFAAEVRGSDIYYVEIVRERRGRQEVVVAGCECPYFLDQDAPCKHIWAAIRVAEDRGALDEGGPLRPGTRLELEPPPDPGWAGDLLPHARDLLAPPPRRMPPPVRVPTPAELFLARLSTPLATAEAPAFAKPAAFRYPPDSLIYVIEPDPGVEWRDVVISIATRKRKQNGDWGKPQPARLTAADAELAPEEDRAVLVPMLGGQSLANAQALYGFGGFEASSFQLSGALAAMVLPKAAATGRLFARLPGKDLMPLAWDDGPPWTFALSVMPAGDGVTMSGEVRRDAARLGMDQINGVVAAGFLVAEGRLAPLTLDSASQVPLILSLRGSSSIDVPGKLTDRLAESLMRAGIRASVLPESLRFREVTGPPANRLRLRSTRGWNQTDLIARLEFDYSGMRVEPGGPPTIIDTKSRTVVHRDVSAEVAATARLTELGARRGYDYQGSQPALMLSAAKMPRVVSALIAEGWHVDADGKTWRTGGAVRLAVTSGIDWFDLTATVEFGEMTVALPDVITALKRGESVVPLGDGSMGMLPEDWLRKYGPLVAAGQTGDRGQLRFRASQTALLDALLEAQTAGAQVDIDEGFRRARAALAELDRLGAADPPSSFRGKLRPYQREALGWFHFLRRSGFGGCLADDMGLGKTVMVLALLDGLRAERAEGAERADRAEGVKGADRSARAGEPARPSVIVVPRSLVPNWLSEAAAFAPSLRVVDYSGAGRATQREAIDGGADVVLVTYGTLRKDVAHLKDIEFEYVILDEAQQIKNAATTSAKSARLLKARHRLALTGTPIENHLGELWSLFDFLNPGLLGAATIFQRAVGRAVPDADTLALMSRALRPFILRRTKQQVARDLPARTEQTIFCELDSGARALYENLRRHYRNALLARVKRDGLAKSKLHVLEALLRLRQAACHPRLLEPNVTAATSAKFDVLLPRLREVMAEGHKALVFSQFTSLLDLLREELDVEGMTYEYLDGKTKNRAARVERFQTDPSVGLFLISLKAGGLGLNLTAAEYVFLLDPWWNPAVEHQAIDRAHRIGQTREVFACRLIARDTVEEKVLALQQTKRDLADAVLAADGVGLKRLAVEDLELLLS